jgi:hypothetical protein
VSACGIGCEAEVTGLLTTNSEHDLSRKLLSLSSKQQKQ